MQQLPIIRIIRVSDALLHEETDPTRTARLTRRIAKGKVMFNPVIVSPLSDGKFVVLDGANRVTAFRALGIPHIAAQVVPYSEPSVRLLTWNHVICDPRIKNLYRKPIKHFRRWDTKTMNEFVRSYKGRLFFHRVTERNFPTVKKQYRDAVCLVVFPAFTPADITHFSRNKEKIPSGITRHIVNGRALRLLIPLRILRERKNLATKNRWLKHYINDRMRHNSVRFYQEPVYLFDEYL